MLFRVFLVAGWALALALGLVCLGFFLQGLVRDHHVGEPGLSLDLARSSAWTVEPFRVWGRERYRLHLAGVYAPLPEAPFRGAVEVKVVDPAGTVHLHDRYGEAALRPERLANAAGRLAVLELEGLPVGRWTLHARVDRPDPHFAGAPVILRLRKDRPDPGMGGLMNYAMIVPAGFFLVLAFLLGLWITGRGGRSLFLWIPGLLLAALGSGLLSGLIA